MALEQAQNKVNKKYGSGVVDVFSHMEYPDVNCVSTGSLKLDLAIGAGKRLLGIPEGRITILWGPKGAGKSTLCNHAIASFQRAGYKAALMDLEFSFTPDYAATCGVNLDELLFVRCFDAESGEMFSQETIWEISEELVRSGELGLLVIDSMDSMSPKRELEGEYGESHPGLQARINAQAMRKLLGPLQINNTALLAVRQVKENIGVMFGPTKVMGGGNAMKHAASVRIDISPGKKDSESTGADSRIYIHWNKIAPPASKTEISIKYGEGVSRESEILELGAEIGVFKVKGAYYYFTSEGTLPEDKPDVHGKSKAIEFLKENPEMALEYEEKIKAFYEEDTDIETGKSEEPGA